MSECDHGMPYFDGVCIECVATNGHTISAPNFEEKTGVCSICGPTAIRFWGKKKGSQLVCRRKQNFTTKASRYGGPRAIVRTYFISQGKCAVCNKTEQENGRSLAIDHAHSCCPRTPTCGFCNRQLLCTFHNVLAGHVEDKWDEILKVQEYLEDHR